MDTTQQISQCIDNYQSFIVEAGAGSGKTWSLIEALRYILQEQQELMESKNKRIVCITYTNVAKFEIAERIDNNPFVLVLTIHEFLWEVIKRYQQELKKELVLINDSETKPEKQIENLAEALSLVSIEYTLYGRRIVEGRISHDDVIKLSYRLFDKYPKISRIVASRYPYIFVDEYQDTEVKTVELLIDYLLSHNKGKLTLGFFGDSMQKIYNQGIGKIERTELTKITKEENYRCSEEVIKVLNLIRPDLIQFPAHNNQKGSITFINSSAHQGESTQYENAISYLKDNCDWDFDETECKVLMLTHKGIADKLDYSSLLNAYSKITFGRERLYEKQDRFSAFLLDKIEILSKLYTQQDYAAFIRMLKAEGGHVNIVNHKSKLALNEVMIDLDEVRKNGTIKDVIDYVVDKQLFAKPERIIDFEEKINADHLDERMKKNKVFHELLMEVPYREVVSLFSFIEESTPFSTKHGVKGAEYENVLVVVDDTAWNQYKFNDVFADNRENENRYNRTLNLFYVCCSRAKNKLAVLSLTALEAKAESQVIEWFGEGNYIKM